MSHTRGPSCADCNTDHRLVRAKLKLTLKPAVRKGGPRVRRLQVDKLSLFREDFQKELEIRLQNTSATEPADQWKELKTVLQETTEKVVVGCWFLNKETSGLV